MAIGLNNLKAPEGATHKKKRVGRGPGSGLGKTSGRGNKGQKSRSGYSGKRGFEGGQMPLHRRLPKRGFNAPFPKDFNEINLGRIQAAIASGRLDAGKTIDVAALIAAGLIRREKDGVRLLAKGEITSRATFAVRGASASAVSAVEKAGGTVTILPPPNQAHLDKARAKSEARAKAKGSKTKKAGSQED
jgi:large subunit ribosomal protein L15